MITVGTEDQRGEGEKILRRQEASMDVEAEVYQQMKTMAWFLAWEVGQIVVPICWDHNFRKRGTLERKGMPLFQTFWA